MLKEFVKMFWFTFHSTSYLQNLTLFKTSLIGKNQWMTPIDVQKLKNKYDCLGKYILIVINYLERSFGEQVIKHFSFTKRGMDHYEF